MDAFEPRKLTWAALLGRWIEFAQSAVALPDDAQGRAWRAAVPHIIGLQAVTMALGQADQLDPDERALGLDRARILVADHESGLRKTFEPGALHPMLTELLQDAHEAIGRAEGLGRGS